MKRSLNFQIVFAISILVSINNIWAQGNFNCGDSLLDSRDATYYQTVLIGNQCWMAENLNIGIKIDDSSDQTDNSIIEKFCFNNIEDSCNAHGGMYQWDELMQYTTDTATQGICPTGWHVPTDNEWKILEGTVDSLYGVGNAVWNTQNYRGYNAGNNLKSTTEWYSNGNGADSFGFTGMPDGYRYHSGGYNGMHYGAYWWTSNEYSITSNAWYRRLGSFYNSIDRDNVTKNYGYSVRCIKNITSVTTLTDSLVAYYPFNGNANDESGNSNNGTVTGATLTTDRFGTTNSAYNFDGNDYINCGNSTSLNWQNSDFSVSAWVKRTTQGIQYSTHQVFVGKQLDGGDYRGWYFRHGTSDFVWFSANYDYNPWVGNGSISSTNSVLDTNWHHYVGVMNGQDSLVELYIDGVLDNLVTDPDNYNIDNASDLFIGRKSNGEYFYGSIDDIRIYNRAITAAEVDSLYQENNWNFINANFIASDTTIILGESVQFTDLSTGSPTSWQWDFGDGTTDTSQNPAHIYQTDGTYTVSLVVYDGADSDTLTIADYINVNSNTNYFINETQNLDDNLIPTNWSLSVHLPVGGLFNGRLEAQPTDAHVSLNRVGIMPANINEVILEWDGVIDYAYWGQSTAIKVFFGDSYLTCFTMNAVYNLNGNNFAIAYYNGSTGNYSPLFQLNPAYAYDELAHIARFSNDSILFSATSILNGTEIFNIAFPINDSINFQVNDIDSIYYTAYTTTSATSWLDNIEITLIDSIVPLIANFTASDTTITLGEAIQFTDLSTGSPTSWQWDFGDGTTDTSQNPAHIYQTDGTYTVSLVGYDGAGSDTLTIVDYITVLESPQSINLNSGWNIISFNVTPDTMDMINILQPLIDSINLIKSIDEIGGFIQEIPGFGWMNTIGDMAITEGYYIKVNFNDSLLVDGEQVIQPVYIPLQTGWNIMGYPLQDTNNAITVLQPLIDSSFLIKVIDEAGGFVQEIPGFGWMNTIGMFDAGEGYYIKVNDNCILMVGKNIPLLTTSAVGSITFSSAISGGNISSNQGALVTSRGVCWGTAASPTLANSFTVDGSGIGIFISNISGLNPNVQYFVRAYATNSEGTAYGNEISFITLATLPTIITDTASAITSISAISGGNITSNGGVPVTARGCCWSLTPNPTIADSNTVDGNGLGTFTSNITGLDPNTQYFLRAYATNSEGTGYGNEINFTTLDNQPPYQPTSPIPVDSSQNQLLTVDLHWACSDPEGDPLTYDVYFGTDTIPVIVASSITDTTYNPGILDNDSTYFWKIVAHDDHTNTTVGDIWEFSCLINQSPYQPNSPVPADSSHNQSLSVDLYWSCSDPENGTLAYDVYIGTDTMPLLIASYITETNYSPSSLEFDSTYYWKIVAHDDYNNITIGDIWQFTTADSIWEQCGDVLIDSRDGQTYTTVLIGGQCWMAENLNVGSMIVGGINQSNNGSIEKHCYNNSEDNCNIYGGLYQWNEMMQYTTTSGAQGICPPTDGWHLPTDDEWKTLEMNLGMTQTQADATGWRGTDEGGKLKEAGTTHWNVPNTGSTNSSGFTALPGGSHEEPINEFQYLSIYGHWWTSIVQMGNNASMRVLGYNSIQVARGSSDKSFSRSVRCVKNPNQPPTQPSTPIPADSSQNQSLTVDLYWSCSDPEGDPLTYDVYFGTDTIPLLVASAITDTIYDPGNLDYDSTYYWKIVAHDDHANTTVGDIWQFTCITNQPPVQPYSPIPADSAQNQLLTVDLHWACSDPEGDPLTYDVYFGTDTIPVLVASSITDTTYDPGNLDYDSTYYWKIVAYDDHANTTLGDTWEFTCLANLPPNQPTSPIPADSAQNQLLTVDLHWACSDPEGDPLTYDVYFGTDTIPVLVVSAITDTTYDPGNLDYDSTYYWKIVAHDDHANTTVGDIWQFTCLTNQPPIQPNSPIPVDSAQNQILTIDLHWVCSDPDSDPLTYDVYFGTDTIPVLVASAITDTTFDPGTIDYDSTYYWKIIAHDNHANTTEGDVWKFTTLALTWQQCGDTLTDGRDGQSYNTVLIGSQCWMAENLNIGIRIDGINSQTDDSIIEKYCYNNNITNCNIYGGLYQWDEMMQYVTTEGVQGICPEDWHIPTDDEWTTLSTYLGGTNIAGGKMKEVGMTYWNSPNTGATNSSGFTALPGGICFSSGSFDYLGNISSWYSSTGSGTGAWVRQLVYNFGSVQRSIFYIGVSRSIRCLKNPNLPPTQPNTPIPADSSQNQLLTVDLHWACSDPESDSLTYDVYFGTDTVPVLVVSAITDTTYNPGTLDYDSTYYWKVVAHDNHNNTTVGDIWEFTCLTNQPPNQPTSPIPADSAQNQVLATNLHWSCTDPDGDPLTYDVYFGTDTIPALVFSAITDTTYDPGTLDYDSTYYWKIIAHDDHSNTTVGDIWEFTCLSNQPPYQPTSPIPADSSQNQLSTVDLHWSCSDPEGDPLTYDVYFGIDTFPMLVASSVTDTTYEPGNLDYDSIYYWKIVAHDNYSNTTVGDIWEFTCLANMPPVQPHTPIPSDSSQNQLLTVDLSWSCSDPEGDILTYDVYFGTDTIPVLVVSAITYTTYNPGTLDYDSTYYWKVVVHDEQGNSTEGDVWQFSTIAAPCNGITSFSYEGQTYNTVQIGTQCWMAENLNVGTMIIGSSNQVNNGTIEKYCYNDDVTNCDTYGGLYQWSEMMQYTTIPGVQGICPYGMHLPDLNEWSTLNNYLGSYSVAGGKMKETGTTHWISPNTAATNSSEFTALPGGNTSYGGFINLGIKNYIWSSVGTDTAAWSRFMSYNNGQLGLGSAGIGAGFSVRCLKD